MKVTTLFATLVTTQALHSVEETMFRLYELLPHIRWADEYMPRGALTLFIAANTLFVCFGIWCYWARVEPRAASAGFFISLWAIVELLNGILHPAWSMIAGTYIPGTVTAPVLLILAVWLLAQQRRRTN